MKYKSSLALFISFMVIGMSAYAVSLDDIGYVALPGDRVQIKLVLSEPLSIEPLSFVIDNPARIALDLPGVELNFDKTPLNIGVGVANSINAIEAVGRTRVVVNLVDIVSYEVLVEDNVLLLDISGGGSLAEEIADLGNASLNVDSGASDVSSIEHIDFRRGENGAGRVIVRLSDSSIPIDMKFEGGNVVVNFLGARLPEELDRKLDVIDFATPVKEIDTKSVNAGVSMVITPMDDNYDHLAYQSDDQYTIEFIPLKESDIQEQKERFGYTGERLSLNFQDIEVRAVLQLIADFTGLNLVASDTVTGNVTLRLKNVPWDQALDLILKTRGLGMRQAGNVIMVAPQEEIVTRERAELAAQQQIEELAPLRTEFIQVNYADANDLMSLIQTGDDGSLLSERGTVSIDSRTNTLIVQDVSDSLGQIRDLVLKLDIPIRQVLIESRIVNADETFSKDIGVRFGYGANTLNGETGTPRVTVGGLQDGFLESDADGTLGGFRDESDRESLIVNLPAIPTDASSFGLAFGTLGSWLLQLELTALIAEGRGEDIASPRVITANQTEAVIEAGVQVPYQEASSSGATTVSFRDAVLSLRVTPHITPDDTIIMDLQVNQDSVSSTTVLGVPAINTRSVATQVLVENGETVVLGGVYTATDRQSIDRTPFFSDLPYVGALFKRTSNENMKTELLIFITPKILKEELNISAGR